MRIDREKLNLAKARACMGPREIVAAGIPRETLYRAERKEIKPETAGRIAKALGVDVTEIIVTESK